MPARGVKKTIDPAIFPFAAQKIGQTTDLFALLRLTGKNLQQFPPFSGRRRVYVRRGSSTMVLLNIDIPEAAGYHLSTKSGWNTWSLNCESFLISCHFSPTNVPASEHRSKGGQPSSLGMGTTLQGCSNFSSSGRLNANLVCGPRNARAAVYNLIYVRRRTQGGIHGQAINFWCAYMRCFCFPFRM
jgi:hypothetical protein